ncbi:MAG: tetratricopeptide repeat protein [Deltaproteobacteria bacterium]|nr:MAG: tetratricopeptide repeat protein [Deltaproteobacteria bacterium]
MIEATCSACGTLNRVSEANVPVGAKFITCADCKSRIAIQTAPASPPAPPKLPPSRPDAGKSSSVELTDLPAPKRASALGPIPSLPTPPPRPSARPAPRSGLAAALDPELPAPKVGASGRTGRVERIDVDDPLGGDALADLPAPKRATPRPAVPGSSRGEITDLPAPKLDAGVTDLLAPKPDARHALADAATARDTRSTAADLPAPKGPTIADLPGPRGPPTPDLPAPRAAEAKQLVDLPAPKGFFDDIPQPARKARPAGPPPSPPSPPSEPDLPAPKGFFDDLPQVKSNPRGVVDVPAPKGFFDDFPQVKSNPSPGEPEVPAPKGFFDDIPGLPNTAKPEVPAPKGYFENIPALPSTARPEVPAPKGYFENIPALPSTARPEVPAPKGHFENVPGRPIKHGDDRAPRGFFDDLPQPTRPTGEPDVHLDAGPELDLVSPSNSSAFDDVELARPSASPVRFEAPQRPATRPPLDTRGNDAGPTLELEGPSPEAIARIAPRQVRPRLDSEAVAARGRRSRVVLVVLLAVAGLGGAGFLLYRRHVAAVEREAAITSQLAVARAAYTASDPQHWQRAADAARRVVERDDTNPEALGIGAESLLASAIVDGIAAPTKLRQAHAMLDTANTAGIAHPALPRARALAALTSHQPDAAINLLQPLATQAPQDGTLALYLGWALAARGDLAGAIKAYDRAVGAAQVKLPALYGRGCARLALADLEGARADFAAVLEIDKDHIAAQVGLAAAAPSSAPQRREADLLAILARRDITGADPRAVAQAWTLAGDAAMRAGRHDVARERFRKALAAMPRDLAATAGLAETELRDGKLAVAAELTATALAGAKDDVALQLVQSEIEIKQRRLPLAHQRLTALGSRAIPLPPLEHARLLLITGKLLEAQGKDDDAADAYVAGAGTARELDLEPMVAAVGKLAALTKAAIADRDQPRAQALRARADALLTNFAEHAARDPQLALTLGIGYLQAGNAEKAEPWLRRAVEGSPNDAEARFQLGRSLLKSSRAQDALDELNAALRLDPARIDIAADLARTYEALGRDADARTLYARLLSGPDPGVEIRARGGRFFSTPAIPQGST